MNLLQQDRPGSIDFDALKTVALSSVVGASMKLQRAGREYKGCCPFHPDRTPSFYVNDDKGFAHCFGCGWHGDVVDFLCAAHGIGVREAVEMLGGDALPVVPRSPVSVDHEPEVDRRAEAQAIWQSAAPAAGTVAEAYLRRRAITIALPETIRFAWLALGRRPIMPALLALVTNVDNQPCGIQRTFLTEDGSKANLPGGKVKFSLGRVKRGAIRLAPVSPELIVCEGLEDGLSLQQELQRPVWVAAGAGMLPAMALPMPVRSIIIGADGDASGEEAAQKAGVSFVETGRAVRIIRPAAGCKDFNAELMEGGI